MPIIQPLFPLLTFIFLACSPGIANAQASPSQLKIATVNMQKLFKEYHRTTEEQQKFSEEFARIQKESNERIAAIRDHEEQLQALKKKIEDPTLADSLRREKSREFQRIREEAEAMNHERRQFVGRRTRALELKKQASMQGILKEIRKLIVDHAKSEDYDFVFDQSGLSANQVPFLLYDKDATNITPALLQKMDKTSTTPPTQPQP